jgi:hypothetical protein
MENHIKTLKELQKVFCLDCKEKRLGFAICTCGIEPKPCPYIISLKYAVEMLEHIKKEYNKIGGIKC